MIDHQFERFINEEVLTLTDLDKGIFWEDLKALVEDFAPETKRLLEKRLSLQKQIDSWHLKNDSSAIDLPEYKRFLNDIDYLVEEADEFTIDTINVDPEIALVAGPQLVVPLKNARFALNAANARWGSLYDALYGSDIIPETGQLESTATYNPARGSEVIAYGRRFLDQAVPLATGSHTDVVRYIVEQGQLQAELNDNSNTELNNPEQLVAYKGPGNSPENLLLKNNGLHIDVIVDREGVIGKDDNAGINDILVEAAVTTIMDCEDSVAAVDTEDKIEVYRNWLGLMRGTLSAEFTKNGSPVIRKLNADRTYTAVSGSDYLVPGKSLLFNRNVGLLMTTQMMRDSSDQAVPEHIIDGVVTALISMIDLADDEGYRNSKKGSIYIVKPKLHGPEEVAFTCDLFARIEKMLGLTKNTIKIGIMDEERRTTINLKECIRQARERLVFINTGFLDRTGDEIHTSMEAGPFLPKDKIKQQPWINAYENRNVDIGLQCGLSGKAQIGKGMWPMPDEMAKMMEAKIQHPLSGANTAWVPSPTAAVLHAMHYHQVDVFKVQSELASRKESSLDDVLTIPLQQDPGLISEQQIQDELRNNIQGILGYVVRWVEAGVGCSKVPDINNIGLMEDRATLRISAKHVANWLHHGLCTEQQVLDTLNEMAKVVDAQNLGNNDYVPMTKELNASPGFQAAKVLIFNSQQLPNGYTEPVLHEYRQSFKKACLNHN